MDDIFNQFFGNLKEKDDFSKQQKHNGFSVMKKPKHWKGLLIFLAVLLVLSAILTGAYQFFMHYWQIAEVGENFTSVFWTNLLSRGITQAIGFVFLFVVLLVNVFLVKKFAVDRLVEIRFLWKKWPYVLFCIIVAFMASDAWGGDLYAKFLLATNGTSFGSVDPIFAKDIGYYIFTRPFAISVVETLQGVFLLQTILMAVIYALIFINNGSKTFKDMITNHRGAFIHTVINVLVFLILLCLSSQFSAEGMMYSSFGKQSDIVGAGYVEANIWINFYRIAPILIIAVIAGALFFLYRKKYMATVIAVALVPAAYIVVGGIAMVTDSLVVNPNERNLQSPYIAYNIEATRRSYGLLDVDEREYAASSNLTVKDIDENEAQIDNIRITDFQATLTAYNQLQYFKRYYTFHDIDIVPYTIDGKQQAVFMAAREMNKNNMEESARSYANQAFRYTHGFGIVASPIHRVTSEGQPEFYIENIPPQSNGRLPEVKQPRIYYGELTNDYVIVGPNNKELDYSVGNTDYENSFDGKTGIKLDWLKRLMFSIHYGDYRMLVSGNMDSESRILINRNIMDRVKMVAPFFTYDSDPYIVLSDDGSLKWVIDGYTTSKEYPYAQFSGNINYIRNSVKVLVDAYTGDMKFYVIDETDPIVCAYRKIYPDLFTAEELDPMVAAHIRVPEDMFKVQSQIYQRYHVSDAGQFYDKADVWRVATEKYDTEEIMVEPYFNVMEIEKGAGEELVLIRPYVLGDRYNMVGLLAMRTKPGHYGELVLYRFPKNETIYGPMQIENKIDNDPEISREMTLWGQGGSSVIRGNMLVIPFRDSIIYVEPIYITSKNNASLPELKRVAAAYKDSIAMESNIHDALRAVIGEAHGNMPQTQEPSVPNDVPVTEEELTSLEDTIKEALASYDRFKAASQSGNWKAMGESLDELDKMMQDLKNKQ